MHRPETTRRRIVVYYRTGLPALDLEKQRRDVDCWGWLCPFKTIAEYTEIEERGSKDRPQLKLAITQAHSANADILIPEIDLLLRKTEFMKMLIENNRTYGVNFFACGFRDKKLPLERLLALAEHCATSHSTSTKEGLAAAKARGVKIGASAGGHAHLATAARQAQAADRRVTLLSEITKIKRETGAKTLEAIAAELMARDVKTPLGCTKWTAKQVSRVVGPVRKKDHRTVKAAALSEMPFGDNAAPKGSVLH